MIKYLKINIIRKAQALYEKMEKSQGYEIRSVIAT